MSKGDRTYVAGLTLFVVSVIYLKAGQYDWWGVYSIGFLIMAFFTRKYDTEPTNTTHNENTKVKGE